MKIITQYSVLCAFLFALNHLAAQVSLPEPKLEFIFEAKVTLDPVHEVGVTTYGKRRIIPINGGTFEGPNMKGVVIAGGADWQTVRADGTADLEARYTLKTDDGVLIYIQNKGIRHAKPEVLARLAKGEKVDPSEYYMRTAAAFEVAEGKYAWLNKVVVVSTGARMADHVLLRFYKVL
ncbi:MAG: DUF3237 domain-containing protein [Saprospiraceae bacterium]|nr:DUF3237 domain-containing protein [Saprospiraceae bacterium]